MTILVEAGAALDTAESTKGITPLMFAATRGHEGVVRVLLEAGASLDSVSHDGSTALSSAQRCDHSHVAHILQAAAQLRGRHQRAESVPEQDAHSVLLAEASDRVGGCINTRSVTDSRGTFQWEEGPNSFQSSPKMLALATDCGLAPARTHSP